LKERNLIIPWYLWNMRMLSTETSAPCKYGDSTVRHILGGKHN